MYRGGDDMEKVVDEMGLMTDEDMKQIDMCTMDGEDAKEMRSASAIAAGAGGAAGGAGGASGATAAKA